MKLEREAKCTTFFKKTSLFPIYSDVFFQPVWSILLAVGGLVLVVTEKIKT